MQFTTFIRRIPAVLLVLLLMHSQGAYAQTDIDAIMMNKHNLCIGPTFGYSHWKDYWEGTLKRNNQNLGTVSTKMFSLMGNYGITDRLNVMVGLPYIETRASAGTLHGMKGLQDISAWLKWEFFEEKLGPGTLSLYGLGGASLPASSYYPDFLPMSIGLHSTTFSGRLMADYQYGYFFLTASGTYTRRNNIHIGRNSYYTTTLHYTDEVEMPDQASFNIRAGYRSDRLIAEVAFNSMDTRGGFDIRRNDMPFPSNKMNADMLGAHFKYTFKVIEGLSLIGGGDYTVKGRNVGQATSFDGGIFYILNFSRKAKKPAQPSSKTN